jgi:hypothetical protein
MEFPFWFALVGLPLAIIVHNWIVIWRRKDRTAEKLLVLLSTVCLSAPTVLTSAIFVTQIKFFDVIRSCTSMKPFELGE